MGICRERYSSLISSVKTSVMCCNRPSTTRKWCRRSDCRTTTNQPVSLQTHSSERLHVRHGIAMGFQSPTDWSVPKEPGQQQTRPTRKSVITGQTGHCSWQSMCYTVQREPDHLRLGSTLKSSDLRGPATPLSYATYGRGGIYFFSGSRFVTCALNLQPKIDKLYARPDEKFHRLGKQPN